MKEFEEINKKWQSAAIDFEKQAKAVQARKGLLKTLYKKLKKVAGCKRGGASCKKSLASLPGKLAPKLKDKLKNSKITTKNLIKKVISKVDIKRKEKTVSSKLKLSGVKNWIKSAKDNVKKSVGQKATKKGNTLSKKRQASVKFKS
jgi:hypothetical protein